jgi:hypothetical protein
MNIKINKELNFFVFIGEISGIRHSPYNKERKKEWLSKSGGKLTTKEQRGLGEFKKFFSSHPYEEIEAIFMTSGWSVLSNTLKKRIGKQKLKSLRNIFDDFSPRFETIWRKKNNRLLKTKLVVSSDIKKIKDSLKTVGILCGMPKIKTKSLSVYLIMGSEVKGDMSGWYSLMGNRMDLALECSNTLDKESKNFLKMILIHELFHYAIRKNAKILKTLDNLSIKNKAWLRKAWRNIQPWHSLEELLVSSFVPEGYLKEKYFNLTIKPTNLKKISNFVYARQYVGYKMKEFAKSYIETGKLIDVDYLEILLNDVHKKIKGGS